MKAKIAVVLAAFLFAVAPGLLIAQQINGGSGGAATPAGSDTQFQYNNAGSFAGSTGLRNNVLSTTCGMFDNCLVVGAIGGQETFFDNGIFGAGSTATSKVNWIGELVVQNVLVKNSGINDCWSSQALNGGDASGLRTGKDTCLARNAAGVVEINNGTLGTFAALKLSTLTATALATDATHTDNTVCVDSTSGLFYKGSGALGVCLGTSSARYKHDIVPLSSSLAQIVALKPSTFFYNVGYGDDGARRQNGFIAEEVASVAPELVALDADGKPNSVDMVAMVPMLVKAMQQQQTIIDCLRAGKSGC